MFGSSGHAILKSALPVIPGSFSASHKIHFEKYRFSDKACKFAAAKADAIDLWEKAILIIPNHGCHPDDEGGRTSPSRTFDAAHLTIFLDLKALKMAKME